MLGGYRSQMINSQVYHWLGCQYEVTTRLGCLPKKHDCVKNFEGSAKSMEPAAILKMVVEEPAKGYVVDWIFSDSDSTMWAHLHHPVSEVNPADETRGRGRKKNEDKDKLLPWIRQPVFKDDPTHRNKVVASKFFDLAKKECRSHE